jgi:hypothetical protein
MENGSDKVTQGAKLSFEDSEKRSQVQPATAGRLWEREPPRSAREG